MFATDVKVIDVRTEKIVASASAQGEGIESILKTQIDKLSSEVSKGLGVSGENFAAGARPVAEVTTTSMEAYNYYLRGREDLGKGLLV